MSGYTTSLLAKRVYTARDGQAYGKIYDLYADRLRRFLFFKLPRQEDAEDLLHETFLRAWDYMTATHVENVEALLFRIARNLIADFYRKKRPEALTAAQEATVADNTDLPAQTDVLLGSERVLRAMRSLKQEYQEVLVMRYLSEMNVKEIASAVSKTPNNIRVLLFRAERALKQILLP